MLFYIFFFLPIVVLVILGDYNGPIFYNTGIAQICPVRLVSCTVENYECQQVPLKLSWVVTIQKYQVLTLEETVVNLGPAEKVTGLAYGTLSRVKNLQNLWSNQPILPLLKDCKVLKSQ